MLKECVIVPTFQRQAFLYLCLEAIRKTEPDIEIHVFPDRGTYQDEQTVCKQFNASLHTTWNHNYHGNSTNMLEALKWAYDQGYERTFIIEDDSIVHSDFFQWSRKALASHPEVFAACGWQYSPHALKGDGPDIVIPWYLSVAACMPRASLVQVVQHARPEYYSNMGDYVARMFPQNHHRSLGHWEQDGLCLRVAAAMSKSCIWPRSPKSLHIGWHGYHMPFGKKPEGTIEEQVALIKMIIADPSLLKSMMDGGGAPRTRPCRMCQKPLLTREGRGQIFCVSCFHAQNPGLTVTSDSHYLVNLP